MHNQENTTTQTETRQFSFVDAHGQIISTGVTLDLPPAPEGCTTLAVAPPDLEHYWDGAQFTPIPPKPATTHEFDWVEKTWFDPRTLTDLQARAHTAIAHWRNTQEAAGLLFDHAGRQWDGGLVARQRLQPVLSLPALPPGFFWTDATNEDVPVDMPALQLLGAAHEQALVLRGFEIHARQRAMKNALADMTREQLLAFTPA